MYHYIDDKDFLKRMKGFCSDIINQLVQSINNDSVMLVKAHLVGSGARNLITQKANQPIDLDYNLHVVEVFGISFNDGRAIKEHIQEHFNIVLRNNGWYDCQDSTSALSTKLMYFPKGNKTKFKIDLAIVRGGNLGWERLIHNKTGYVVNDQWYWNEARDSRGLEDKVRSIKDKDLWHEVRDLYLNKKKMYLQRNDRDHPSFIVYIETINEVYYKHFTAKNGGNGCLPPQGYVNRYNYSACTVCLRP